MQKRKTPLPLLLIASYTHTHTYCPKNIIRGIVTAASAVIRTNGGVGRNRAMLLLVTQMRPRAEAWILLLQ